jgi:hypothetical protein
MKMNLAPLLRVTLVLVSLVNVGIAGPLTTDPNALSAWQGTTLFSGTVGSFTLKANVDFAVYAPGQFGTSAAMGFPGHSPADPSGGAEYVYAYEIFNSVSGGNAIDLNLSVGLAVGGIPNGSTNITNDPLTPAGGIAPDASTFIPGTDPEQSAKWSYNNGLAIGAHSDILIFTSPFAPQLLLSSMQGGHATTASSPLPSPVPEPATMTLSLVSSAALIGFARFRRRGRAS